MSNVSLIKKNLDKANKSLHLDLLHNQEVWSVVFRNDSTVIYRGECGHVPENKIPVEVRQFVRQFDFISELDHLELDDRYVTKKKLISHLNEAFSNEPNVKLTYEGSILYLGLKHHLNIPVNEISSLYHSDNSNKEIETLSRLELLELIRRNESGTDAVYMMGRLASH